MLEYKNPFIKEPPQISLRHRLDRIFDDFLRFFAVFFIELVKRSHTYLANPLQNPPRLAAGSFTISIPGEYDFQVGGFTSDALEVFDISGVLNPKMFVGLGITGTGPYSLAFEDSVDTPKTYLALTEAKMRTDPAGIERFESRDLKFPSNGADWIAIAPEDFIDEVQPLAQHRREQRLRAMVDKILAYEASSMSDEEWERRVLLVADDDGAGFERINEACSDSVSPAYLILRSISSSIRTPRF